MSAPLNARPFDGTVVVVVTVVEGVVGGLVVGVADAEVTVKVALAVVPLVSPVAMTEWVPAGVPAGMVTEALKSPLEFAVVVPRLVGVLCNVRSTVSPGAKPVPETVIVHPVEALHAEVLRDTVPAPAAAADTVEIQNRTANHAVAHNAVRHTEVEVLRRVLLPDATPAPPANQAPAIQPPCN